MDVEVLGIDLGKNSCSVVGLDSTGRVVLRRRMRRGACGEAVGLRGCDGSVLWRAEAIAEAATRPTMRFVALKTEAQLDVQVLHRVRDRLVGQRTALMNQVRSVLLERGIVVPRGRRKLLDALGMLSAGSDGSGVGSRVRLLLDDMLDQWRGLDRRIAALDDGSPGWHAMIRRHDGWRPSRASAR